ncbi:MAG: hypothetical protein ABW168_09020 [Sedimenticola sp.]
MRRCVADWWPTALPVRKYGKEPEMLVLERQAREEGRGLWALQEDQRVAPWEWRKGSRGPSQ